MLNRYQSSSGVKGIGHVSPMKSKVTGNTDSPRSRWVTRSKANVDKDKVKDTTHVKDKVQEKRKTELPKDKSKDKAYSVKDRVLANVTDKPAVDVVKDNASEVVKEMLKDKPFVVKPKDKSKPKVSTELHKDKPKDKPSVVKAKFPTELPKNKYKADLPRDKPNPKDKQKVDSEAPVLRSKLKYHSKKKLKVKMAKGKMDIYDSNSQLDSDQVDFDSSSDEVSDQKLKKLKIKAELKRKRKGGSDSDSSSIDEKKSKKKGKKKEKQLTPEEAAHEEYLLFFLNLRARTVSSSLFLPFLNQELICGVFFIGNRLTFDSGDYVEVTPSKIHDILEFKDIRVGDIDSKLVFAQEVDFLFKVNFLTLFTNTMCRVAGLKGQICLDVVRRLREDCVISKIDWCGYIHSFFEDSELPKKRTVQYLGPFTFLILLYLDSTKFDRFPIVRTRPTIRDWTSTLMIQRHDLEKKNIDPISFDVDVSSEDGGNDNDGDDDKDPGNGNSGEELNDQDPSVRNLIDPTVQETIVEDLPAEEHEITCSPEAFTQWLDENADFVLEVIDCVVDEYLYVMFET
ncbi:hypothetical protein Tco_1011882 [Tanacetum coccineum]